MTDIYLDYQATTALSPEAFDAMVPFLRDQFGNPHSMHRMGRAAAAHVELARERVAMLFPARGRTIFTSGATEALNMAIVGAARKKRGMDRRRTRVVTLVSEHAAVLDTVQALTTDGFEPVLLPVGPDGLVDLAAASAEIDGQTALVAVMLVNNEIGVIQPIEALCEMAHQSGTLFLCDAVQGCGRVPMPTNPDMIAISAHKIHGPKGVGALWLRDGIDLPPLMHGGGQEQGVRSGTLSPALCAGFGVAARQMAELAVPDKAHVEALWARAVVLFDRWIINGPKDTRYHGNLNIRRDGLDAARLLSDCRNIAFSLGSACASGSGRASHVLQAIGLSEKEARSSVRLGFGRYTTLNELEQAAQAINRAADSQ